MQQQIKKNNKQNCIAHNKLGDLVKVLWAGQQPLLKQCNSKENQWCTVLVLQTCLPKRLLMDSGVWAPPSCGVALGRPMGRKETIIMRASWRWWDLLPMTQGFSELWCSPLVQKLLFFVFFPILSLSSCDAKTAWPKSELCSSKARRRPP